MKFGGRFKKIEPKYIGDKSNNGIYYLNEVYALREAGLWPKSSNSSLDNFFESNKLILSSITDNISDISVLNLPLTITKFEKDITDGPLDTPINAIYNDDYSNSNGSYASIVSSSNSELIIDDQDYTLECWVKPIKRHPNGYYTLFSTYISGTDGAVFGFDNDGRIFADGGFGNWAFGNITNGINVSSGQWHHIAFCRSGGILRCFVNGTQYGSNADSGKIHTASTIRVGNYDNQSYIGYLTEVRVSIGVSRYVSSFSTPNIPLPTIEQETAPFAPILLDPLYNNGSVDLFWKNTFNGGSYITSFDIEHATLSDMSNAISENLPVSFAIGGTDTYWNSVALLLKADGDNGTTQFTDLSKTTKTITAYGSAQVSTSQSKFGTGSLSLPSAGSTENSDRLEIASDTSFNFGTSDFTIEAWVYFEGFSNEETIVAKSNNSGGSYRLVCAGASRNLAFYAESQNVVSSNNVFTTGQWYHVAACRTNGTLRLFIDGSEVSSGPMTINLSNNVPLTIGNYAIFGSYSSGYEATFDGFIDEVRITNSARYQTSFTIPTSSYPYYTSLPTTYEVVNLTNDTPYYFRIRANNTIGNGAYSSIIGPVTPSVSIPQRLIGGDPGLSTGTDPYEYYTTLLLHFDGDNASTTFTDANVPAKTATLAGTPTISTTQSKYGGASGSFLNNGDYLSFASSQDFLFASGDFTIEAWIYPIAPATDPFGMERVIVGIWSAVTPSAQSWQLYLQGGSLKFIAEIITGDNVVFDVPNVITQEQWYHVAVVRNGTQMYLFVDGVRVSTYNCGTSNMTDGSNTLGVGGYNRGNSTSATFNGYIDDLRITKGVARYTADFSVPTAAFADPSIAPKYIGVSYRQDDYWYATSQADKIFDGSIADNNENQWKATSLNRAFGVNFGIEQTILRYKMWRNTGNQNTPTSWILQGSNTQSDWDNLQNYQGTASYGSWQNIDVRNNVYLPKVSSSSTSSSPFGLFVVSNPGSYKYYRLFVSSARADGPGTESSRAWIAEMQFLGIIQSPDVPTNFAAYASDGGASLSWSVVGPAITGCVVEWSGDGGVTVMGSAIVDTQGYSVTGLTNGSAYVFRVKAINTSGESSFTSWSDPVTPAEGYTPIQDNIFRYTLADSATGTNLGVATTTGYYKLVADTGETSSVTGNGNAWGGAGYYSAYYFYASITGLSAGTSRTISVISCDASGTPSGEIIYVTFDQNGSPVIRIDASGCSQLLGFRAASDTSGIHRMYYGPSTMPSSLLEVRAVGVAANGGFYNQGWNPNYYLGSTGGSIAIAGHQLSAAALNQLYTDLSNANNGVIVVHGNPGTSADDPSVATAKGYIIYGS